MMDTPQARLALAQEGFDLACIFLFIRLGLRKVSDEERCKLRIRADRYQRIMWELNHK